MTARQLLGVAQRLLATVVLVVSGAYLLIYLYRWEWNRAIISGLFFVAAEVALAASMLLRRLHRVEEELRRPGAAAGPAELLRTHPAELPDPFAWLRPRGDQLGVFVPVLLGAGAVLSALAYVVERLAEATALPAFDRRLARRLEALAPPPGGVLAPGVHRATAAVPAKGPRPPGAVLATIVATAAFAVLTWLAVTALIEATQTRPDTGARPVRTTIELVVHERGAGSGAVAAVEALWIDCRSALGSRPPASHVVGLGDDRAQLVLEPGVGRLAVRRLTGCLSDLRLNLVRATVTAVESTPPPS